MKNAFQFRDEVISDYERFSRSFTKIAAEDIKAYVEKEHEKGRYWPKPLIQINPNYRKGKTVQALVDEDILHPECGRIFKTGKPEGNPRDLQLYTHQQEALAIGLKRESYIVTTGTGSGKSLAFFIPIVDCILREKEKDDKPRTRAIVIYPMNALANSQLEELEKYLHDYPKDKRPFTVERYTGQEDEAKRESIAADAPDILLTNYMMLELLLTRYDENDRKVMDHCAGLEFLVLDELHTYRGRQGADVSMLVRRVRLQLEADSMVCIGTSATMSNTGSLLDQKETVSSVAEKIFGHEVKVENVVQETLERVTDPALDMESVAPLLRDWIRKKAGAWTGGDGFTKDPLAVWVELTLGIQFEGFSAPQRAMPMDLAEAAGRLAKAAGVEEAEAYEALQAFLLEVQRLSDEKGVNPFAFKLHQFISGPGKVQCTLEPEGIRHVTLNAQQYAPGMEDTYLYSTYFCRECGQEYHPVRKTDGRWLPRDIDDPMPKDGEDSAGFLVPEYPDCLYKGDLEGLPDFWIELKNGEPRVKSEYRKRVAGGKSRRVPMSRVVRRFMGFPGRSFAISWTRWMSWEKTIRQRHFAC